MYRILLICISLIINSIFVEFVFADAGCGITNILPSYSELSTSIERCIQARIGTNGENPNSIEDFRCPQAEMVEKNNQEINNILPYLIYVNMAFNKTDTDIKKYMLELQKSREADPIMWIANIRECTDSIAKIYTDMCDFSIIRSRLNEGEKKYIISTVNYPQILCPNLAEAKIQGWHYLATIFMSDSINKNQQNSTDRWIADIKGAYGRVLGAFNSYRTILFRAVSKMNCYIKESN